MKLCANCASVVDLDGFVECNDCTMEERALADDAARIITVNVEHAFVDGREATDERAWLARYREARGR